PHSRLTEARIPKAACVDADPSHSLRWSIGAHPTHPAYARAMEVVRDFPLFPLGLVALPSELIPLHIFEERYKAMVERCLSEPTEFGIVWMADDGVRPIGCACEIAEVLERLEDGRINLVARGTRVFRIEDRHEHLPYPAGTVAFLTDPPAEDDPDVA